MDSYKVYSNKADTLFVHQMKFLPKKLSVKWTQDRIKK